MKRLAMIVLWPSFLAAALAEACFFALFDPSELGRVDGLGPMSIYGIGFFLFWTLCALASMLTCCLARMPDGEPPF